MQSLFQTFLEITFWQSWAELLIVNSVLHLISLGQI